MVMFIGVDAACEFRLFIVYCCVGWLGLIFCGCY